MKKIQGVRVHTRSPLNSAPAGDIVQQRTHAFGVLTTVELHRRTIVVDVLIVPCMVRRQSHYVIHVLFSRDRSEIPNRVSCSQYIYRVIERLKQLLLAASVVSDDYV
jgi:hypothetical protein